MNNAQNVSLVRALATHVSANVGAAYSVLWGPFDLRLYESLAIEIENPDITQTLDVLVDIASAIGGPWSTQLWNGLQGIAPSTNRADIYQKAGQLYGRLIAKADGAGVNGVIYSVSGIEQRLISGQL